jgi:hypothetical protein
MGVNSYTNPPEIEKGVKKNRITPPSDQTSGPNFFILWGFEAIFEFLSQSLKSQINIVFSI